MGLPIARRLVEEHGGVLVVEAVPAGGTVARLELPVGSPPGKGERG